MEYTVDSVRGALSILMVVAHNSGLGVTEIAKLSGNSKTRAFRMLTTLEEAAFVQREKDSSNYLLGHMSLVLGLAAQKQVSLTKLAAKHLEALGALFNENAQLLVRDGMESVNIARWESSHDLRVHNEPGKRRPLHVGASGKLLLAYAPDELKAAVFDESLQKLTLPNVDNPKELRGKVQKVLDQGYAYSSGEAATGVVALAAPVRDARGVVIAALGISFPTIREPADISEMVASLKQAAAALSADLGWTPDAAA